MDHWLTPKQSITTLATTTDGRSVRRLPMLVPPARSVVSCSSCYGKMLIHDSTACRSTLLASAAWCGRGHDSKLNEHLSCTIEMVVRTDSTHEKRKQTRKQSKHNKQQFCTEAHDITAMVFTPLGLCMLYDRRPKSVRAGLGCVLGWTPALSVTHSANNNK